MRDEGVGIAGKDYSYCILMKFIRGIKEVIFPFKIKVSKEQGGQKLATLFFFINLRPQAVDLI